MSTANRRVSGQRMPSTNDLFRRSQSILPVSAPLFRVVGQSIFSPAPPPREAAAAADDQSSSTRTKRPIILKR